MPDTPQIPETAPGTTPSATLTPPTEATPEAPTAAAAADAPAPRAEPSVADTARLLAEHFPALFGAGVVKPIKLRIHADIQQRVPGAFTKKALSIFLQRHTTGTAYLRALVAEGATRTDLDGQPAGDIAADHREAAGLELDRRRAIVEAKKLAAREAARATRQEARKEARPDARPAPPDAPHRPDRAARPPRPDQAQRRPRPPQADAPRRRQEPPRERRQAPAHEQERVHAPAVPLTPEQAAAAEARQQRAMLLRSFEQSPLSKANFGALKGLSEPALDELLALARQERSSR